MSGGGVHGLPTPTALLRVAIRRYPERIAFTGHEPVRYRTLEDVIGRYQAVLASAGVARGRTVALLSRNRWDAWAAASAVSASGAAPCWLHPLGTAITHVDQVTQVAPAAVIVDATSFPDRVDAIAGALPGVPLLTLGDARLTTDLHAAGERAGTTAMMDLSVIDDPGMIGLTGGTTGKSKAVERSAGGVTAMYIATLSSFAIPPRPSFLAIGPISHVTGVQILPTLIKGGSVSMVDRFDPEEVLTRIERERASFTLAVPTMVYDLLDAPALNRADISSLRLLLYGGAAMSPSRLMEGLDRVGRVFSQLYGQAECHPISVLDIADHDPGRPDVLASCGFPVLGAEIRLLDDQLQSVPDGEVGEICVRSPSAMTRYSGAPDATAEALAGGWLHTGDLGRLDAEGRLSIVDRKKDMVVSGGFNIYPREIEDVLTRHPDVAGAAVLGMPDARWGEAVHAVVTPRPGCSPDATALRLLVREQKGAMMTPKSISVVASLPLTAAGKVDKRRLREMI